MKLPNNNHNAVFHRSNTDLTIIIYTSIGNVPALTRKYIIITNSDQRHTTI